MHRANASVVLVLGLLGCASLRGTPAGLGWSLGGEAHVFIAGDAFARRFYRQLTGSTHLADSLTRRPLIPVQVVHGSWRRAQVFSAAGSTPATITLARFHAPRRCGHDGIITELVLAFRSAGASVEDIPPPHEPVVATLGPMTFRGGAGAVQPALSRAQAVELLNRVGARAAGGAALLQPLALDPDQAADAGEVVPLGWTYGVGVRARIRTAAGDTMLVTGIAATDGGLRRLRWIVKPRRIPLAGGIAAHPRAGRRYSLRGPVAAAGVLVLVHEIADVSARDSRAAALIVESGRVLAAQPLALRCP